MNISFFKQRKPKQFYIEPRYWDPALEKKEERKKRIERKVAGESNYSSEEFRKELQHRWGLKRQSKNSLTAKYTSKKSFLILVVVLLILVYIIYSIGK